VEIYQGYLAFPGSALMKVISSVDEVVMMRILNVGCGRDTYGTDFLDMCPMRMDVITCDINKEKYPYDDNTFDQVYSSCLFEHLVDRSNFMAESVRVLKPGGKLQLITDNASYIGYHILGRMKDHKYQSEFGINDNHYSLFTPYHLESFAKLFGLKDIIISYPVNYGEQLRTIRWLVHMAGVADRYIFPSIMMEATK
jgi:SAM-dependent methyltransferase